MPMMIDADSLLPLIEVRKKAYDARVAFSETWLAKDKETQKAEVEQFMKDHDALDLDCEKADRQLAQEVDVLVYCATSRPAR